MAIYINGNSTDIKQVSFNGSSLTDIHNVYHDGVSHKVFSRYIEIVGNGTTYLKKDSYGMAVINSISNGGRNYTAQIGRGSYSGYGSYSVYPRVDLDTYKSAFGLQSSDAMSKLKGYVNVGTAASIFRIEFTVHVISRYVANTSLRIGGNNLPGGTLRDVNTLQNIDTTVPVPPAGTTTSYSFEGYLTGDFNVSYTNFNGMISSSGYCGANDQAKFDITNARVFLVKAGTYE